MPWQETDAMSQRIEFVVRAQQPGVNFSALCRTFGVSRTTGYKWVERAAAPGGLAALAEQSRRPHGCPHQTPPAIEARVVALRGRFPWGGRKLHVLLARDGLPVAPATIDRILKRHGLTARPRRHPPATRRFERATPNALWQMDFKGEYRLAAGGRCYPLSILDDHSRYVVGLHALPGPRLEPTWRSLVRTFETHGVPDAMLMDHGVPWWSTTNGHGLTRLAVFLIRQGIQLHYSGIGHPQTQGKVERFHRTLKHTLWHRGVPDTLGAFADALEQVRVEYNTVRPHEALDLAVPASRYQPSARAYQPTPPAWEYPAGADVRRLNGAGCLEYQGRRYFVCEALASERVQCERFADRVLVRFRHMYIREINLDTGRTTAVVRPV